MNLRRLSSKCKNVKQQNNSMRAAPSGRLFCASSSRVLPVCVDSATARTRFDINQLCFCCLHRLINLNCPNCGGKSRVIHKQQKDDGAHRWLRCNDCNHGFRTLENYFTPSSIHPNAVLTHDDVRRLREKAASGTLQIDLAEEYGISLRTVSRIVNRQLWRHVS